MCEETMAFEHCGLYGWCTMVRCPGHLYDWCMVEYGWCMVDVWLMYNGKEVPEKLYAWCTIVRCRPENYMVDVQKIYDSWHCMIGVV